jgi:Siphovirus Gp157
MKLYEIDSAIQAIYDEIEQNEGVLPDELESALNGLQMERTTKIGNVLKLLKNINGDITKLEVEANCLKKKLQSLENHKQSVKNYLAYAIGEGNKFKNEISSVHWTSSESVVVDEKKVDKLPDEYKKVIVEPCKTLLKDAIKHGSKFEGVEIVTKKSIVVR